jgi:hypothetical protein
MRTKDKETNARSFWAARRFGAAIKVLKDERR